MPVKAHNPSNMPNPQAFDFSPPLLFFNLFSQWNTTVKKKTNQPKETTETQHFSHPFPPKQKTNKKTKTHHNTSPIAAPGHWLRIKQANTGVMPFFQDMKINFSLYFFHIHPSDHISVAQAVWRQWWHYTWTQVGFGIDCSCAPLHVHMNTSGPSSVCPALHHSVTMGLHGWWWEYGTEVGWYCYNIFKLYPGQL